MGNREEHAYTKHRGSRDPFLISWILTNTYVPIWQGIRNILYVHGLVAALTNNIQ